MNLKKEFEKILSSKRKFYISIKKKKEINYENYYKKPKDPDGKIRILKNEKNYKLTQFKIILNYLSKIKGGKILDIGCGYGWLLSVLNKNKWKRYGVEINYDCHKIAKKNMDFIFDDINKVKNNTFDVVTLIHVIEHIKNPIKFLQIIKKKLRKNGVLIIETPDFDSAMARIYNTKFRLLHDPTHITLFSLDSISKLMRNLNFKIIKYEFPFFEGPFFNKNNMLKLFIKNKKEAYSPPFYGSVMTLFMKNK